MSFITFNYLFFRTEFADPPPLPSVVATCPVTASSPNKLEDVIPAEGAPTTLMEWAVLILNTPHPTLKVKYPVSLPVLPC